MKRYLIFLFLTMSLEARIADSINNVDLIIDDKINEKGQNIGDSYHIHNRNHIPVQFTFKLTESVNAKDKITEKSGTVERYTIIPIGSVTMDNLAEEAIWSYELAVRP